MIALPRGSDGLHRWENQIMLSTFGDSITPSSRPSCLLSPPKKRVVVAPICYSTKKGHSSPPLFGPSLLWPNGRPSRQLLISCSLHLAVLAPPLGVTPFRVRPRCLASENYSPWAIVWRCLRDLTFSYSISVEHRLLWDRHTSTSYTALAWRRAVKSENWVIIQCTGSIYFVVGFML